MTFSKRHPVYAVGTKVRLVKHRKDTGRVVGVDSSMEALYGNVVTIKSIFFCAKIPYYKVEENGWYWDDSLIEGIADTIFCVEDDGEIENASFGKFFANYAINTEVQA